MQTEQVDHTERVSTTEILATDNSSAAMASLGGLRIADYTLTERLGSGGYGEVWKAIGPGGLPKAVKVLYGERNGAHAEAEMKALERMRDLRHPFLLSIERIEVVNSRLIVVTELADGNLSQRFDEYREKGQSGIPRDELLNLLKDTADALDFMSEKHGLQHLDIKPDNILLQGDHAKVGDFGLAKDLNATNVSILNGFTPTFAAPELFEGRPGRSSDQYSLAIVYQYMLTGGLPFNGRTAAQLTAQHLRSQPDLANLQPVDRPVIARALSKNLHSRFDSCRQFVDELSKRKHSRTKSRATVLNEPEGELIRTALLNTDANDTKDLSKEQSVPIAISPENAEGKSLRPSVFIGIGGLAGAVLSQLKQIGQAQSSPVSLPILHLDTDRGALAELKSGKNGPSLVPDEMLAIPLRSSKEYRNATNLDLSWLSRRWLFNIPRSGQVEGIRPLGRLALFDHHEVVSRQLETLLSRVVETNRNSDGIDVYVVAATSGGTSSGAVADAGLLLRGIAQKLRISGMEVHGILMHATGAMRNVTDVQEANTTSVLQELTHMTTPGLATPRGLNNRVSDAPPFDHTYVVHLGDGLSHHEFANEAANVAGYLFSAAATTAQHDFRAWRDADVDEHSYRVRALGISNKDAGSFQTASSEGGNLCSLLLRRWCGFIPAASPKEQQLPVELTDTKTILEELKLSSETLPTQVRTLLKGECGRAIDAFARDIFQRLQEKVDLSSTSRSQILNFLDTAMAGQAAENSNGRTLHQIVSELQTSLQSITRNSESALRSHFVSLLDKPHRLEGANVAARYVSGALNKTTQTFQNLLTEIEAAFTQFVSYREDQQPFAPADNVSLEATARAFCREYCCLIGYQTVYQCFANHIMSLADSTEKFSARLDSVKSQLESMAAAMADSTLLSDAVPQPIIDAFDRHVRTSEPGLLGNHLTKGGGAEELRNQISRAATQFLMAASDRCGQSSISSNVDFPKNCWPRFRGCGGRRRVLGVVPKTVNQEGLLDTLRKEFDDCVATRSVNTAHICVVCEIEGVAAEKIIARLTHSNPHIADVASRIHTRTDVDW